MTMNIVTAQCKHCMAIMSETQLITHICPQLCPYCQAASGEFHRENCPIAPPKDSIQAILSNRGKEYGPFVGHADITQQLKQVMGDTPRWSELYSDQKEALEMIAHKIGRILNGNPNNVDSWADIAGYAKLVADRLNS